MENEIMNNEVIEEAVAEVVPTKSGKGLLIAAGVAAVVGAMVLIRKAVKAKKAKTKALKEGVVTEAEFEEAEVEVSDSEEI